MKNISDSSHAEGENKDPSSIDRNNSTKKVRDLLNDPDYLLMLQEYQHANWDNSEHLLSGLLEKYPNDPRLDEFKQDFNFQFSIHKNAKKNAIKKTQSTFWKISKNTLIIIFITIFVVALGWVGFSLLQKYAVQNALQYKSNQVTLLSSQIEALILSDQPGMAADLLEKMKQIDPQNPKVAEYAKKVEKLASLETLYSDAISKMNSGSDADALSILQTIQNEYPGYRDVTQLISTTQTKIEIAQTLTDATTAYKESRWTDAINGFERIQELNPDAIDSNIKEMLLNSYLRQIIQMLESDNTSINDINQAEIYYRRAIAMIPQSRIYQSERENLQKISSSLLELKYTQTAYALIEDPNQTQFTVNQAVNYLKKSTNLNPSSSLLQSQLDKIELYQVGFQDYIEMNWSAAIDNLEKLVSSEENYANGFAKQLLYESHMGRGSSYFSVGLYLDARKEYEAAENLVWDQNNKMTLFMTEVQLGKTLGRLKDYQNAASYFKYTFEAVDYATRGSAYPSFVGSVTNAIQDYVAGNYQASYEAFLSILPEMGDLFTDVEFNAQSGTCLALVASQNHSSVQAILDKNDLARQTLITVDQQLIIPTMSN